MMFLLTQIPVALTYAYRENRIEITEEDILRAVKERDELRIRAMMSDANEYVEHLEQLWEEERELREAEFALARVREK